MHGDALAAEAAHGDALAAEAAVHGDALAAEAAHGDALAAEAAVPYALEEAVACLSSASAQRLSECACRRRTGYRQMPVLRKHS